MTADQTPPPTGAPASAAGHGARDVWLVFARRKYEESLYQVGSVTADTSDMAAVFARSITTSIPGSSWRSSRVGRSGR